MGPAGQNANHLGEADNRCIPHRFLKRNTNASSGGCATVIGWMKSIHPTHTSRKEAQPMSEHEAAGPNIVELAEGVSVIDDVLAVGGVDTLEGRVGPLLFGETGRAHYLDMPAGSYVDEHAHDDEAFTLTVRGSYVLCANGRRMLMKPGSFFWFGAGTPTGYEVPFDEPAYILVFRGVVQQTPAEMLKSLDTAKDHFVEMQQAGVPFALRDLPEDHPARLFAHEVNPTAY